MITLGPFLLQKQTDSALYWGKITLGGYQTQNVCMVQLAPFEPTEATFPADEAFIAYDPAPDVFHAFNPEGRAYFSLVITGEYELQRFIPHSLPQNFTPLNARVYTGSTLTVKHPPVSAPPEIAGHGCQAFYEHLRTHAFVPIITAQYETTKIRTAWVTSDLPQSIPRRSVSESNRNLWSQDGFFFAWESLKDASRTPEIYAIALQAVLSKGALQSTATAVCIDENIFEEVDILRKFLTQAEESNAFHAMFIALFKEFKSVASRLDHTPPLHIAENDRLSFPEAYAEHIGHGITEVPPLSAENIMYYLTAQARLRSSLDDMRELAHELQRFLNHDPVYEAVRTETETHFEVEFEAELAVSDDTVTQMLDSTISNFLARLSEAFEGALSHTVQAALSLYQGKAGLATMLLTHTPAVLKNAFDVQVALSVLQPQGRAIELLDALDLTDKASPFLQTFEDLVLLNKHLHTAEEKKSLQKKRQRIADWGELVFSLTHLRQLAFIFSAEQVNRIIAKHAQRFGFLIDSNEAMITALTTLGLTQIDTLLPHIPNAVKAQWIQTPKRFRALLTAQITKHAESKIIAALVSMPSPYRITALLQCQTHTGKAQLLSTIHLHRALLYWQSLSEEEWGLLFQTPADLKALIQALRGLGTHAAENSALIMRGLPASLISELHQSLLADEAPLATVPTLENFDALKQGVSTFFPPYAASHLRFYADTDKPGFHLPILTAAIDVPGLKHALLEIYCRTNNPGMLTKVIEACQLIDAYEKGLTKSLRRPIESDTVDDGVDARETKRLCIS